MHHYVAREIIRQRTGEMRAQARRDAAAKQALKARHRQNGQNGQDARRPGTATVDTGTVDTGTVDQGAGAEVIPMPRVPDYSGGTYRDAGPRSHAC
jgi:hypothetical protein